MPRLTKTSDTPEALRPFQFHGLDFQLPRQGKEATADCIFCDKEGKFYINMETGQWNCKRCGASGNICSFLEKLVQKSQSLIEGHSATGERQALSDLSDMRGLLSETTLSEWLIGLSPLSGKWLIPATNAKKKLNQVYRYSVINGKGKFLATPTLNHGLMGLHLFDKKKPTIYLCEGIWDAMVLWEILGMACRSDENEDLFLMANKRLSLRSQANVIGLPGMNVFQEEWIPLFEDKEVVLLFDNDYPVKDGIIPSLQAMERITNALANSKHKPASIKYLQWGREGYNRALPNGYDVRDALTKTPDPAERVKFLQKEILYFITPVPSTWTEKRKVTATGESKELPCKPCDSWRVLQNSWRRAMKWTEGLERALAVMLSSIISTETRGEQLWVKVMGPPSCGKTTLCEALSVARKYVYAKSTIRGFHSGYKTDRDGDEDHSLIPQINHKTLIVKDGDTLLQSPNLGQILAEARDLFDGTSRAHYRHGVSRNYENVRVTWILCGTSSLRALDASELGARFLDCIIMEGVDPTLEEEVNRRVLYRALRNVRLLANGSPETHQDEAMIEAKQLTGGYINYLRDEPEELLSKVSITSEQAERILSLGTFVSYMRARPSARQDEIAEREFSARLVEQYGRLTICLAAVTQRYIIDDKIMAMTHQMGLDTARGKSLDIVRELYRVGEKGLEAKALAFRLNDKTLKVNIMLRFLRKIGVVSWYKRKISGHEVGKPIWILTERLVKLYKRVVVDSCLGGEEEE